jgi:hypothetical protein
MAAKTTKKATKSADKQDTTAPKLPDLAKLEEALGRAKQQANAVHVIDSMLRRHKTQPCMLTVDDISYVVDSDDSAVIAILKKREAIGQKNIKHTLAEMKNIIDSTGMFQQ